MNKLDNSALGAIVSAAAELFLENTIESTSIKDVAAHAGCGEATIYRRFGTKQNLAVQAASHLALGVLRRYFDLDVCKDGFSALAEFYRAFLRVFEDDRRYFRFIRELDSYFLRDAESKEEYEDIIFLYYHRFQRAYGRGLADGTVRKLDDPGVFYYASCHALLNLCKTLSAGSLLRQDETPHPEYEVAALIDMILYNLIP